MKQFLIIVITFCASFAFAQGSLEKGKSQINAGLGLSTWGIPLYAGADFAIHESITLGPKISYQKNSESYLNDKYRQSLTVIAVNGNYHFNKLLHLSSPWDLYGGLMLGYYIWSDVKWNNRTYPGFGGESSGVGAAIQIGSRYFFNDQLGIHFELGGGTGSGANLGITFKP